MAHIPYQVDINLYKNTLLNAKLHPLPTASRTALSLSAGDAGFISYDTTLNILYVWNGTGWQSVAPSITGALVFKSSIAAIAAQPVSPSIGDLYIFNSAGTTSWTPSAIVDVGDQAYYDGTNWQYIQTNVSQATTSTPGLVSIATQLQANTGSNNLAAITPSTLAGYVPGSGLVLRGARRFATIITSLVGGTASTITHNLTLNAAAEVTVTCYQGGQQVMLAINPIDANSITVSSNITLSNVTVVCVG